MIASIIGRFDNAPAHIIINSPRYCTRDKVRDSENDDARKDAAAIIAAKKAAEVAAKKEARALAWQAELVRRAEARAIVKAVERRQREEQSARLAREAKARKKEEKKKAPGIWLDTRPKRVKVKTAHAKNRDAEQKRERYAAKVAALKATIPAGWVQSSKLGLDYSVSGLNVAMKTGRIRAVKIGRYWYCDPSQAKEYADSKYARRCAVLDKARPAAIKARHRK